MPPEKKIPNSSEIDQALREFEAQAAGIPVAQSQQQGEQIEQIQSKAVVSNIPAMVRLVMKCSGGAIKEQRTAEYILLGLAILMLGVSFYLFFGRGNLPAPQLSPEELKQMELEFEQELGL